MRIQNHSSCGNTGMGSAAALAHWPTARRGVWSMEVARRGRPPPGTAGFPEELSTVFYLGERQEEFLIRKYHGGFVFRSGSSKEAECKARPRK